MASISPTLQQAFERAPQQAFRVIVRTSAPAAGFEAQCRDAGMTIHHTYKLVPGLAITASGAALLQLAQEPWVQTIEPDQTMHTTR